MQEVMRDAAEGAGLDALEAIAVREAALYADKVVQVHDSVLLSRRLQGTCGPERFLVIDLAGTLRIGQLAAARLMNDAERLVLTHIGTLAGLRCGRVLVPQARVVLEETGLCDELVAAEVDRRLHAQTPEGLAGWTGRRLRDRLRTLVLTVEADLEPEASAERERTAREARRVSVRPEPDGMASLWALLPAEQLRAFTLGLDELHRRQLLADRDAGVERTADQRRADLLALLPALALHALDGTSPTGHAAAGCGADGCGSAAGISLVGGVGGAGGAGGVVGHPAVVLNIHVPLSTALGLSGHPATLDGYGPISAAHARALLPTATLRRIVVDDTTGEPLRTRTSPTLRPATSPAAATSPSGRRAAATGRTRTEVDVPAPRSAADSAEPAATATATSPCGAPATAPQPPDPPGSTAGPDGATSTPEPPDQQDAITARLQQLLRLDPLTLDDLQDPAEPHHDPSTALARFVRLRDPLCTAPGCATSSRHCDLDHEAPWPHGLTTAGNLRPKSRRCHRAKTLSWTVTRHDDGTHTWSSPTGRAYTVPPTWSPPPALSPPSARRRGLLRTANRDSTALTSQGGTGPAGDVTVDPADLTACRAEAQAALADPVTRTDSTRPSLRGSLLTRLTTSRGELTDDAERDPAPF